MVCKHFHIKNRKKGRRRCSQSDLVSNLCAIGLEWSVARVGLSLCMFENLLFEDDAWYHKRLLRPTSAKAALPLRISDKCFYQKVYRTNGEGQNWSAVFGVSESRHTADKMTSNQKLQIEYLKSVFQQLGHYSVPVKVATASGSGAAEVRDRISQRMCQLAIAPHLSKCSKAHSQTAKAGTQNLVTRVKHCLHNEIEVKAMPSRSPFIRIDFDLILELPKLQAQPRW